MTSVFVQKEIKELKERQGRLERLFYSLLGPKMVGDDGDFRPEYIKKLHRISRRMHQGKGFTAVRTQEDLKRFLGGF